MITNIKRQSCYVSEQHYKQQSNISPTASRIYNRGDSCTMDSCTMDFSEPTSRLIKLITAHHVEHTWQRGKETNTPHFARLCVPARLSNHQPK